MLKCSNVKKLRTAEPQPIFTGSYKKKKSVDALNVVTAVMTPSFKSSCFSDGTNVVLIKPEKFSVATNIFLLQAFRMSTVNACPGWSGIVFGLNE